LRHTRSRDHKGFDFYSRLADELLAAGSSTFIGGRAGRNHARLTTGIIIDFCHQQTLIPRRMSVDELFDDTTRMLAAA
jgi:hypothetical protein